MLDDPSVVNIVRHCGGDVAKLRLELEQYLTDQVEVMPDEAESGPEQTISFQRVLQRALMHAQGAERDVVTSGNLLVAMFRERDSLRGLPAREAGRDAVRRHQLHQPRHLEDRSGLVAAAAARDARGARRRSGPPGSMDDDEAQVINKPLEQFTTDLVERAALGKIDPLVGRELELERTVQVLCRRRKNNPLARRRAGRRQDRDRRGPGAAHPRGQGAGAAQAVAHLRARHDARSWPARGTAATSRSGSRRSSRR